MNAKQDMLAELERRRDGFTLARNSTAIRNFTSLDLEFDPLSAMAVRRT